MEEKWLMSGGSVEGVWDDDDNMQPCPSRMKTIITVFPNHENREVNRNIVAVTTSHCLFRSYTPPRKIKKSERDRV